MCPCLRSALTQAAVLCDPLPAFCCVAFSMTTNPQVIRAAVDSTTMQATSVPAGSVMHQWWEIGMLTQVAPLSFMEAFLPLYIHIHP